ncbi:MAG: hypothetical protein QOG85_2231 [Gaiellaceae bacterium]|nr:hypothetical protein [Gaiellaceae bacterium]
MANHLRQQVCDRIAQILAGLTTTEDRVYQTRVYPLAQDEIPCLLIYGLTEEVDTRTLAGRRIQDRNLRVAIEAVAQVNEELEQTLNRMAHEVEAALGADQTLGALLSDASRLERTEIGLTKAAEDQKPAGTARLTYVCKYITREGAPDVRA